MMRFAHWCIGLICVSAPICGSAQAPYSYRFGPYSEGNDRNRPPLEVGDGFTPNNLWSTKASALRDEFDPDVHGKWISVNKEAAKNASVTVTRIRTREQLLRTVGIGAEIEAQSVGYKGAASFAYSDRTLSEQDNLTFVVKAQAFFGEYGFNPKSWITQSAVEQFYRNYDKFEDDHGSRIVHRVLRGVSVSVILQIEVHDLDTSSELEAALSAGTNIPVGGFTGSLKSTFEAAMKLAKHNESIKLQVLSTGGNPAHLKDFIIDEADAAGFLTRLQTGLKSYIANNFNHSSSTPMEYRTLKFSQCVSPRPGKKANPEDFYSSERDRLLKKITDQYYDVSDTLDLVDEYRTLSNPDGIQISASQKPLLEYQRGLYGGYKVQLLRQHKRVLGQMSFSGGEVLKPHKDLYNVDEMYHKRILPEPQKTTYVLSQISSHGDQNFIAGYFSDPRSFDPFDLERASGIWAKAHPDPQMVFDFNLTTGRLTNGRNGPASTAVRWIPPAKGRWKITFQTEGVGTPGHGSRLIPYRDEVELALLQIANPAQGRSVTRTVYMRLKRNEPVYFRLMSTPSSTNENNYAQTAVLLHLRIEWAPIAIP